MTLPKETLMAYVDGELDAPMRARVEMAMAADPETKRYVEQQLALRAKLRATFDRVLDEPVPERLLAAARGPADSGDGKVATLADARAARASKPGRRWALPEWGAMAACLVIGLLVGQVWLSSPGRSLATRDGQLVARGGLAEALSNQLASTQSGDVPVQIGVSFRNKSGDFCRTFEMRDDEALAGLACRAGDAWRVEVLARIAPELAGDRYRYAGTELPKVVLRAIEDRIDGEPLDAAEEAAARERGW